MKRQILAVVIGTVAFAAPAFASPKEEVTTAALHAGLAAKGGDIKEVHTHLHHALNCLVGPDGQGYDAQAVLRSDLALLRQLPGVADATNTNTTPLSQGGWNSPINLQPRQKSATANTAFYMVDSHALGAFGLRLVAGRNFKDEEVMPMDQGDRIQPSAVIVTKPLAETLFPDSDAVGKQVYLGEDSPPSTIVGVVERMQQPWIDSSSSAPRRTKGSV